MEGEVEIVTGDAGVQMLITQNRRSEKQPSDTAGGREISVGVLSARDQRDGDADERG